jgi:hypothetical protein
LPGFFFAAEFYNPYICAMKKPISIKVNTNDKSPQAKRHKQFNNLLNKINKLKDEQELLKAQVQSGVAFFYEQIKPLHIKQQDLKVEQILALDRAYGEKIFKKKDKEKIAHLIETAAIELFEVDDREFEEIIPIFEKYSEYTHEEVKQGQKQETIDMTEEMLRQMGVDINIDEEDELGDIMEKLKEAAQKKMQEETEKAEAKNKRPKTEKQQQKEDLERQKEKDIQKVSKNIYNELVRLLHPDRESDEAKRAEKTEAIQRVNEAYERNDLYQLLTLQAEFLNKDGRELALMPEKEFKYYLQVLKKQQADLEEQIMFMGMVPGIEGFVIQNLCNPNTYLMELSRKQFLQQEKKVIKGIQNNLDLAKDPKSLKIALQDFEIDDDDDDDDLDFDSFLEMLGNMMEGMPKGGGKKKKR